MLELAIEEVKENISLLEEKIKTCKDSKELNTLTDSLLKDRKTLEYYQNCLEEEQLLQPCYDCNYDDDDDLDEYDDIEIDEINNDIDFDNLLDFDMLDLEF